MSLDASLWAWKAPVNTSTQRLVLVSLADRAGEDHSCFPSAHRLQQDTLLNRKTILKAITDLIEQGLILDTGKRVGNGVRVLKLVGVNGRELVPKITHPKIGTSTKNGTSTHPKNGTSTHPNIGIQNLSIESTNESTNICKFSFSEELKKIGAEEQLIKDWMLVRKSKKAKDTKTAFEGFQREVSKSELQVNEVLRICIERDWKGFNASWLNKSNTHTSEKPSRNVNDAWDSIPQFQGEVASVEIPEDFV